jgi:putative phosphoesterase
VIVGLISDTHGLLRPAVLEVFAGVDLILHAGDVGSDLILDELETIAPVRAVYGNTDLPGNTQLHDSVELELLGHTLHVSHGHEVGSPTPEKLLAAYSADIIVYGHTHKQMVYASGNRLVVNPGAAGPRRFNLAASVALLTVTNEGAMAQIVDLADQP